MAMRKMKHTHLFSLVVLVLGTSAFAAPDGHNPPVAHTNQGRTVGDQRPQPNDRPPPEGISISSRFDGDFLIPPTRGSNNRVSSPVRLPEPPIYAFANRVDLPRIDSPLGQGLTVTPAPGTLGLVALGGIMLARRRRGR